MTTSAKEDQVILPLMPPQGGLNSEICYFGHGIAKEAGMILVIVKLHRAVKNKSFPVQL